MNHDIKTTFEIRVLVSSGLPVSHDRNDSGIDTADFLMSLLQTDNNSLDEFRQQGLETICRSLSVAGNVKATYDLNWERTLNQKLLPPIYWPLMIAVLSRPFQYPNPSKYDLKGEELKRLNAALTALDISCDFDMDAHLLQLRAYLENRLQDTIN